MKDYLFKTSLTPVIYPPNSPIYIVSKRRRKPIARKPMKWLRIEQKRNEEGNYIPSQDEEIQELSAILKAEEKKAEKAAKMDRVLAFIKIRNLMEYGAYCIERERIYKK